MKESNKKIYVTNDYGMFNRMMGNRTITTGKINKIINSIQKIGYITNPIIVNENMEIIDGQNRLEALKILRLPVEYVVVNGVGTKECILMNCNQTNWKMVDYIESYAEQGNKSYVYIKNLLDKYTRNVTVISVALTSKSRFSIDDVINGDLVITDEQYTNAIKKLDFVYSIIKDVNLNVVDRNKTLFKALIFCYEFDNVDNNKLVDRVKKYSYLIGEYSTMIGCLGYLEKIYNFNNRGSYISFTANYQNMLKEQLCKNFEKINNERRRLKEADEESIEVEEF